MRYFIKNIFVFILLINSFIAVANAHQQPIKIVTLIAPLASLISLIGGEHVSVDIISSPSGCIHHHHITPSQFNKLTQADVIFVLNKDFDGKILRKLASLSNMIYLSDNFLKSQHIWLNIDQTITILYDIYTELSKILPQHQQNLQQNLQQSLSKMALLKQKFSKSMDNNLALSNSIQPFWENFSTKPQMFNISDNNLKFSELVNLQKQFENRNFKCLILDEEYPVNKIRNIIPSNINLVQLNIEHWPLVKDLPLAQLYDFYMLQNLTMLNICYSK